MRRLVLLLVLFLLGLCVLAAAQDPQALIVKANESYDRFGKPFDLSPYETDLRQAITLWQEALPLLPADAVQTKAQVLNHLAEGYFELAEGYLTTTKDKEAAYEQGKDAALASLRLDPSFDLTQAKDGFRAALSGSRDVAGIFWYGNDLGRWLNHHVLTAITGGMQDVLASFERAVALDETYLGGGPQRSLACFLAQVPGVLGGDLEAAKAAFERAIALDPGFIENYVDYAEYYAKPKKDWDLFTKLLDTALEKGKDEGTVAEWPFYNALALKRAQTLRQEKP